MYVGKSGLQPVRSQCDGQGKRDLVETFLSIFHPITTLPNIVLYRNYKFSPTGRNLGLLVDIVANVVRVEQTRYGLLLGHVGHPPAVLHIVGHDHFRWQGDLGNINPLIIYSILVKLC